MTSHESFNDELTFKSAHLFALVSSAFERDFDTLGYAAPFSFEVAPSASLFTESDAPEFCMMAIGREIDKARPWSAEIGYVAENETLGFTVLEIPLRVPNGDQSLVFRRVKGDRFLVLHKNKEEENTFSSPLRGDDDHLMLPGTSVDQLIALAGYSLPGVFTSPNDMRLQLAELADSAKTWEANEQIHIAEDVDSQVILTRQISKHPKATRTEFSTTLAATFELFGSDESKRQRMSLVFEGTDHELKIPTMAVEQLAQTDAILGQPGTEEYAVVAREEKPLIPQILDRLSEAFVEILG